MSEINKAWRLGLPLIIVVAGIGVTVVMVKTRPEAKRTTSEAATIPVDVVTLSAQNVGARVLQTGVVAPAVQIDMVPEVAGRVTSLSKNVMPGGRLKKGETLLRIDPREFSLAIQQETSRVRNAELELQLEEGRQKVASSEWQLLQNDAGTTPNAQNDLALRKPHLDVARVAVDAAKSGLGRAELNLERTVLRAPFNAMILSESVDVGQRVSPPTPVARLIGTDQFWVVVSLPVEQLQHLQIPGVNGTDGSAATITQQMDGAPAIVRHGQILQLQGQLDPQTRRAQLLVRIDAPLGKNGEVPMLPGAYVEVALEGEATDTTLAVPREAVKNLSQVWVVSDEDKLVDRTVQVRWSDAQHHYVVGELQDGDRVVASPLAFPIAGMTVHPQATATAERLEQPNE